MSYHMDDDKSILLNRNDIKNDENSIEMVKQLNN